MQVVSWGFLWNIEGLCRSSLWVQEIGMWRNRQTFTKASVDVMIQCLGSCSTIHAPMHPSIHSILAPSIITPCLRWLLWETQLVGDERCERHIVDVEGKIEGVTVVSILNVLLIIEHSKIIPSLPKKQATE